MSNRQTPTRSETVDSFQACNKKDSFRNEWYTMNNDEVNKIYLLNNNVHSWYLKINFHVAPSVYNMNMCLHKNTFNKNRQQIQPSLHQGYFIKVSATPLWSSQKLQKRKKYVRIYYLNSFPHVDIQIQVDFKNSIIFSSTSLNNVFLFWD